VTLTCPSPDPASPVIIFSGELSKCICKTQHFKNVQDRGSLTNFFKDNEAAAASVFNCYYCKQASNKIISFKSKKNPDFQLDFCSIDCLNTYGSKISVNAWNNAVSCITKNSITGKVEIPDEVSKELQQKTEEETRRETQKRKEEAENKRKRASTLTSEAQPSVASNLRSKKTTIPTPPPSSTTATTTAADRRSDNPQ
jgi:hypothetical protein